jgi:DNA invertase Pin-like site-specific DNA recombinase
MKKVNKSQQIRDLIDKGVSNNEIVKKLKVSQQLVYIVSRAYRGKNAPRKAVKRVGAVKKSNVSDLIAALKTIIKALERA